MKRQESMSSKRNPPSLMPLTVPSEFDCTVKVKLVTRIVLSRMGILKFNFCWIRFFAIWYIRLQLAKISLGSMMHALPKEHCCKWYSPENFYVTLIILHLNISTTIPEHMFNT